MIDTTNILEKPLEKEVFRANLNQQNNHQLFNALALLPTISLHEMSNVKLMNRIDSKFLVKASCLPELIRQWSEEYLVQQIDGKRMARYKTTYLDTKGFQYFLDHVNGKLNHFKWRIRCYTDSDLSFLEIKKKSNKGRTDKERIRCHEDSSRFNKQEMDFIALHSGNLTGDLHPVLQNNFNRITLVNSNKTERLTIDLNISFTNCLNDKTYRMGNFAIIELKQEKSARSVAAEILSLHKIKRTGISKYCLGLVLTSDKMKGNIYKQKIRTIHTLASQP